MFLPVHDDPQHALLHLKVLVLPEVDMQRRARFPLTDTFLAQVVRLAHGAEAGTVFHKVVQDRVLGRGHGGVVGRGRALHRAGREPLLDPARWHFAGCCGLLADLLPGLAGGEEADQMDRYAVVHVGRREPYAVMG